MQAGALAHELPRETRVVLTHAVRALKTSEVTESDGGNGGDRCWKEPSGGINRFTHAGDASNANPSFNIHSGRYSAANDAGGC